MKIKYTVGVKTQAGWRSVDVVAEASPVSAKMAEVIKVISLDDEEPRYGMSRTGAKRQQYNGLYFASAEVGKKKRLGSCEIVE